MDLPRCEDQPFVMAIIGRRGSGKGYACIELLKYFYRGSFDFVVWVSPTFQLQEMCLDILDHTGILVFSEWRPEIITSLYQYMNERNQGDRQGRPKEHCLLILDDVGLLAKRGRLSEQLDNIAFTSRHYGISTIEIAQRITLLTTSVRSQLDALLMFQEQNPQERINMYKSFGFCDKKLFNKIFDQHTEEEYSYIGIRNKAGRLYYFTLDGEIPIPKDNQSRTSRTSDRTTRTSDSRDRGLPGIRDSERYQEDLRRLTTSGTSSTTSTTFPSRKFSRTPNLPYSK